MDTFWQDLRHSLRILFKNRGFTTVAILTLAIGIGSNTAIFSIVRGVLMRPLPYPEPESIVRVMEERPGRGPGQGPTSFLTSSTLEAWREDAATIEQIAGYSPRSFTVSGDGEPVKLSGASISPAMLPLLRAVPHLGRLFTDDEEKTAAANVVLLSHSLWQSRYEGDTQIVGRALIIDGNPHTVIGVLPRGFYFPDRETQLWTPMVLEIPGLAPGQVVIRAFSGLARLRPGVPIEQAVAEGQTIVDRLQEGRRGPMANMPTPALSLVPLQEEMVAEVRPALVALWFAVGFVLLIASANLANLLLSRATARRREMAIRAAVGAGRGRLIRQALTESTVLSLLGGALGLLLAFWIHRGLPRIAPGNIPRIEEVTLDAWVLVFCLAVSLFTGLLFGIAPALKSAGVDLVDSLGEGSTGSASGGFRLFGANRTRSLLAIAEVALAVVLLIGAGLLIRSFVGLIDVDPGYDPSNVLTTSLQLPSGKYDGPTAVAFQDRLLERLAAIDGIEAAGTVSMLPLSNGEARMVFQIDGRPPARDPEDWTVARPQLASAGYLDAMGLRLLEGRWLRDEDDQRAVPVAVVNEAFVRAYFAGEGALGRRLQLGPAAAEIVGVVADTRHAGLDAEASPEVYRTFHQGANSPLAGQRLSLVIRTSGDPMTLVPRLRTIVLELDPDLPLDDVNTMEARLSSSVAQPRFYALLLGLFATFALLLAAIGIYGILAYTVSQRRREIGIRRALGAQGGQILSLVLRQGLVLTAIGLVVGLVGSAAATRLLSSLLFGVELTDGPTYVLVAVLLVVVACLSCLLPARRAMRLDPIRALHYE